MSKYGAVRTEVDGISSIHPGRGHRPDAWTADEDAELLRLRAERVTLPRIAEIMGRSECGVENHWLRLRRRQGLSRARGLKIDDPAAHFWERVDQSGGPEACWPWMGKAKYLAGYGAVVFNMGAGWKNYGAHRVAYFLSAGRPQAPGSHVMHACDNKPCCNPAHLSEGSRSENMRDAWARGRSTRRPALTGEAHHNASLTEHQVRAIRRLREAGAKRQDIADAVGISTGAIDNITARRSWRAVA